MKSSPGPEPRRGRGRRAKQPAGEPRQEAAADEFEREGMGLAPKE